VLDSDNAMQAASAVVRAHGDVPLLRQVTTSQDVTCNTQPHPQTADQSCLTWLHIFRADPVLATVISVDGGVFEHYLAYRGYLRTALGWMIGRQNVDLIKFNQFRESSSRGAAYLAAAVRHQDGISSC